MTDSGKTLDALNAESELLDLAREPSDMAFKAAIDELAEFAADGFFEPRKDASARNGRHVKRLALRFDAFAAQAVAAERALNAHLDAAHTAERAKPAAKCYRCGSSEHYIENCPLIGPAAAEARREGEIAMRERAARVAAEACLVPPDGGSPTDEERFVCEIAANAIRVLSDEAP